MVVGIEENIPTASTIRIDGNYTFLPEAKSTCRSRELYKQINWRNRSSQVPGKGLEDEGDVLEAKDEVIDPE